MNPSSLLKIKLQENYDHYIYKTFNNVVWFTSPKEHELVESIFTTDQHITNQLTLTMKHDETSIIHIIKTRLNLLFEQDTTQDELILNSAKSLNSIPDESTNLFINSMIYQVSLKRIQTHILSDSFVNFISSKRFDSSHDFNDCNTLLINLLHSEDFFNRKAIEIIQTNEKGLFDLIKCLIMETINQLPPPLLHDLNSVHPDKNDKETIDHTDTDTVSHHSSETECVSVVFDQTLPIDDSVEHYINHLRYIDLKPSTFTCVISCIIGFFTARPIVNKIKKYWSSSSMFNTHDDLNISVDRTERSRHDLKCDFNHHRYISTPLHQQNIRFLELLMTCEILTDDDRWEIIKDFNLIGSSVLINQLRVYDHITSRRLETFDIDSLHLIKSCLGHLKHNLRIGSRKEKLVHYYIIILNRLLMLMRQCDSVYHLS
jgi:hypothetical protein